jgi:hypothetical protein
VPAATPLSASLCLAKAFTAVAGHTRSCHYTVTLKTVARDHSMPTPLAPFKLLFSLVATTLDCLSLQQAFVQRKSQNDLMPTRWRLRQRHRAKTTLVIHVCLERVAKTEPGKLGGSMGGERFRSVHQALGELEIQIRVGVYLCRKSCWFWTQRQPWRQKTQVTGH